MVYFRDREVTEETRVRLFLAKERAISGTKRTPKETITAEGKEITGRAIPLIIPYCSRAVVVFPEKIESPLGIRRFSAVTIALRRYELSAVGTQMDKINLIFEDIPESLMGFLKTECFLRRKQTKSK